MPPEAIDLASRLLQYSPSLRCTAVGISKPSTLNCYSGSLWLLWTIHCSMKEWNVVFQLTCLFAVWSSRHVRIRFSMNSVSQMLVFQMADLYHRCSTSNKRYVKPFQNHFSFNQT